MTLAPALSFYIGTKSQKRVKIMASEYLQRVKVYVDEFDPIIQQECMKAIKSLRMEQPKFSYKWIHKALSVKDHETWAKYGFGLLFTHSYRAQVNCMIKREESQEIPTWDWFENDMED